MGLEKELGSKVGTLGSFMPQYLPPTPRCWTLHLDKDYKLV